MSILKFAQRSDGAVLTEMVVGAIVFVVVGIAVADFALSRKSAPLVELQTEPERARLIQVE